MTIIGRLVFTFLLIFVFTASFGQTYTFNDHIFSPILYLDTDTSPAIEVSDTWPVHPKYYEDDWRYQTYSSISDAEGELIAYSHSRKIFGPNHLMVTFGDSLSGGMTTHSGCVFVPKPGSENEIYLFHIAEVGEKGGYHTVLDPKTGAVNPNKKNIKIHDRVSAGRVLAVRHSNNYDWWVLFFSRSAKGEIVAFKVTAEGVSSTPVLSYLKYQDNALPLFRSQFVISSDGRLMAYVSEIQESYITKFNTYHGRVYDSAIDLDNGVSNLYSGFGTCFSPYGCKLYISPDREKDTFDFPFIQLALTELDSISIGTSSKVIYRDTSPVFNLPPGQMFFGFDGTIYCPYKNLVLSFHNPDADSGQLVIDTLVMSGNVYKPQLMAPNVIDKSRTTIRNFTYENQCLPDTTQFYYLDSGFYCVAYDSLKWNFGDSLSNNNASTEVNPKHLYSATGDYFTTLVRYNGNVTDTISQYVTISARPVFYLPKDTISCDGTSIGLRMDIKNSQYHTLLKSYWNNKEGIKFYRADNTDTIIAKAVNQLGCVTDDTTFVWFSQLPQTSSQTFQICHDDTVHLPMKTGASMVYWNNDSSATGWAESEEGTYYLTWKDVLHCERTDTVIIQKSEALRMSPDKDTTICRGESLLFSVPAASKNIQWVNGDTTFTYKAVNDGLVKVRFEDSLGCVFADSIYFTVNDSVPVADFTFPKVCSGDLFTVETNGGVAGIANDYRWIFNGRDTFNFNTRKISHALNDPGIIEVILVINASNGCSDSIKKEAEILAKPIAGFTVADVCHGDSVQFNNTTLVHSGYVTDYTWRLGDGNTSTLEAPMHWYDLTNDNEAETFFVSLTANITGGCKDSTSKTVTVNPLPNPYFEARIHEGIFLLDSQATKEVNYQYHWTFGNGASSNAVTPSYTYPAKDSLIHRVCLRITTESECSDSFCIEIKATLGLDELAGEKIKIYPNPTNGTFRIEGLNDQPLSILIFDSRGALLAELNTSNGIYDVSGLTEGNYTVKIITDGATYVKRLRLL